MSNNRENQDFALRSAAWLEAYREGMAATIRDFASQKGRGKPPIARVYLRDVAEDFADHIALQALSSIVQGVRNGEGLTAMADKTGRAVKKMVAREQAAEAEALRGQAGEDAPAGRVEEAAGAEDEAPEETTEAGAMVALGYWLISAACEVTGAAKIVDRHGDKPQKVEGGVKLTPVYELAITDGKFLADAAEFGAAGMPSFAKKAPRIWTDQSEGGVIGQRGTGMVHGAGRQMRGVTCDTAPALFDAVNAAQRAVFRVNQTVAPVVTGYDPAKAYAWLLEHFIEQGIDPDKAKAKAREAARL